jgi:arylsulfatase A-like enzyme
MSKRILERRWPWILAACCVVVALLSTTVEIRHSGDWDRRPLGSAKDIEALRQRDDLNVLFIVVDTLRAERLGSYGYARDTSPVLDRLASSGIRFSRHLAQSSWTKASMASLWLSLNPARTGITRFDHVIPEEARMPAEILSEAGFQTVGLYRNGWVAPTFGFDQGFEVYKRPLKVPLPPGVRRENPTISTGGTDEAIVASAVEFLRLRGRDRWFLYLHLMDVHEYLYDEESALFGVRYTDVYDNSIRWTDGVLEVLLSSLAEFGHLDDTLIVLTSDHGEAFSERGFEGHARKVYRETTDIPLLISLPFRLEPGIVIESRTRNVDIWPTILDLLGLEVPPSDGRSRVEEILASARGESPPEREGEEIGIAHLDQTWARPQLDPMPTLALVEGPLRYVRVEQQTGRVEQLYDATDDPREFRDRATDDPETLRRLAAEADAYLESSPDWGPAPTREIGELEMNHLRALGYALP